MLAMKRSARLERRQVAGGHLAADLDDQRRQRHDGLGFWLRCVLARLVRGQVGFELGPAGADAFLPCRVRQHIHVHEVVERAVGADEHDLAGAGDHQDLLALRHVLVRQLAGGDGVGQRLVPLLMLEGDVFGHR